MRGPQTPVGLQVLRVSRCGLGERGAAALGKALSNTSPLEELDLSWNMLGLGGARALAAGIKASTEVRWAQKQRVWSGRGGGGPSSSGGAAVHAPAAGDGGGHGAVMVIWNHHTAIQVLLQGHRTAITQPPRGHHTPPHASHQLSRSTHLHMRDGAWADGWAFGGRAARLCWLTSAGSYWLALFMHLGLAWWRVKGWRAGSWRLDAKVTALRNWEGGGPLWG